MVAHRNSLQEIRQRSIEFAVWLILIFTAIGIVFVLNGTVNRPALDLSCIPLPLIAWATMRFGTIGTSLAVILISVGAVFGTSIQSGPFYHAAVQPQILMLWTYMVTTTTLGWLIAALRLAQVRAVGVQQILEQAINEASLGVLLTDESGAITYASSGFAKLTGYSETELLGNNCRILQGENTDPRTVAQIKSMLAESGQFDGEILNYRKDGTSFWNALLIVTVRDSSGQHVGFLGIQRDATDRKQAEIALQQSEARLRTILNLEPHCVKIVSADGRLMDMNPAGLAMIEADCLEQALGATVEDLIEYDHRAIFHSAHQAILNGGTGQYEFAIRGLKGTRRWLESSGVPYRDPEGRVIGQLAVTQDVTARRQSEAILKESRDRLNEILNSISEVVYSSSDAGDETLFLSAYAETLSGRAIAEFLADPELWRSIIHPEDRQRVVQSLESLGEHESNCIEYRIVRSNDDIRWVQDCSRLVRDAQGTPLRIDGVVSDITERKRANEELRATLREKEAMLKEIHHRVKNNLQIISSLLSLQVERVRDDATLLALRESQNRVRSMALVHETLYQSGNLGRIDLSEYVSALCRHLFRSHGIDGSVIHLSLNVDHASIDLEQAIPFGLIINELVSNSLKYAFPDGRSGRIQVDFKIVPDGYHMLNISDDGVGLPEEFDLRQRQSLGLHLVQDLINQLSGCLTILRAPSTEFRIKFPLPHVHRGR
jgi:PAS domain S-box-containing protein